MDGSGYARCGHDLPHVWHTRECVRSWYVSAQEQCGHSGTAPHSRHMRKFAKPLRFSMSTAFWRLAATSCRASAKGAEKIERLPPENCSVMSTTRTAGSRAAPGRSGMLTRVQLTPPHTPSRQRSSASSDGVADPSTRAQPRSAAMRAATSRAW